MWCVFEPVSNKMYNSAYAPLEDSNQPAHLHKVTDGHSMGSQGPKVSSGRN